jgi:quinol monooxygenase YgiN
MNRAVSNIGQHASFSRIDVRFRGAPPVVCEEVKGILEELASTSGCSDYTLTSIAQGVCHWSVLGLWTDDQARARHYASEALQRLFACLLQRHASLILCSEGRCPATPTATWAPWR